MDMESAYAMMNGNDDAITSIAEKKNCTFYSKDVPESVKALITSLGGKIVTGESYSDIIFE